MCFCCRVLRSFTPAIRFYLECPAFGLAPLLQRPALVHACLFSFVRKKSGLRYVPFLFRVPSHAAFCVRLCASVGMSCVRPCATVAASCARPRLSFFLCQEKRSGLRYVSFLFREVGIAVRAFSKPRAVIELCRFTSGCAFLYGDSDGVTGDAGVRSRRRGHGKKNPSDHCLTRRVLRSALRFCWNVLRSSTPVFFPLSGKKKRLAVCFVPVPRGRNRR